MSGVHLFLTPVPPPLPLAGILPQTLGSLPPHQQGPPNTTGNRASVVPAQDGSGSSVITELSQLAREGEALAARIAAAMAAPAAGGPLRAPYVQPSQVWTWFV